MRSIRCFFLPRLTMKALSCSFPKQRGTHQLSPAKHASQKKKGSLRRLLGESFFRRFG